MSSAMVFAMVAEVSSAEGFDSCGYACACVLFVLAASSVQPHLYIATWLVAGAPSCYYGSS